MKLSARGAQQKQQAAQKGGRRGERQTAGDAFSVHCERLYLQNGERRKG
jgi:hypothetical protein